MAAPITDGAADSAVASSKAAWQAIFPFEIRAATASETSGAIVMSGGCFVLNFPLCRLAMVPSRICLAMVLMVNVRLTQARGGRNQADPQNVEYRSVESLCSAFITNVVNLRKQNHG